MKIPLHFRICISIPLNSIGELLKGVLTDLCGCNFVHVKTALHAYCMHTRNHAHNLLSPDVSKNKPLWYP